MTCSITSPTVRHVSMRRSIGQGELEMAKNPLEKPKDVLEAQRLIKTAAWVGYEAGESRKSAIRRAAAMLSLGANRAHELWYGLARRIDAAEMDQLCKQARYADAMKRRAEQHAQEVRAALFDRRQYSLDLDGGPHSPSRNAAE